MVGVLILTHGRLAEELLAAARTISGDLPAFEALSLDWRDDLDAASSKVNRSLAALEDGDGVLILTDIYGGTPSNIAMRFKQPGKIEVVSGVNLPMVVRLGCTRNRSMPLGQMATWIRTKGRASICSSEDIAASNGPRRTTDPCAES